MGSVRAYFRVEIALSVRGDESASDLQYAALDSMSIVVERGQLLRPEQHGIAELISIAEPMALE